MNKNKYISIQIIFKRNTDIAEIKEIAKEIEATGDMYTLSDGTCILDATIPSSQLSSIENNKIVFGVEKTNYFETSEELTALDAVERKDSEES